MLLWKKSHGEMCTRWTSTPREAGLGPTCTKSGYRDAGVLPLSPSSEKEDVCDTFAAVYFWSKGRLKPPASYIVDFGCRRWDLLVFFGLPATVWSRLGARRTERVQCRNGRLTPFTCIGNLKPRSEPGSTATYLADSCTVGTLFPCAWRRHLLQAPACCLPLPSPCWYRIRQSPSISSFVVPI